jgi:hypothetical protein
MVKNIPGQLSVRNYGRRWRLVNVKKIANWWPKERYVTLDRIEDIP